MSCLHKIIIVSFTGLLFLIDNTLTAQNSRGERFVKNYYPALFQNNASWFRSELRNRSSLFSYRTGRKINGKNKVLAALKNEARWFYDNGADTSSFKSIETIYTREKMVHLAEIAFPQKDLVLPIAVIADVYDDGINDIRSYYCKVCIDSIPVKQNPIYVYNSNLESILPPSVYGHVISSKYGKREKIVKYFSDTTQMILQNGLKLSIDQLSNFYELYLPEQGLKTEATRLTYDGDQAALEWNIWKWGDKVFPKSSGMTYYKFNSKKEIIRLIQFDQFEYPDTLVNFLAKHSAKEIEIEHYEEPIVVEELELQEFKIEPYWYLILIALLLAAYFILKHLNQKK